jgi:preprotein translocase subunit SecG
MYQVIIVIHVLLGLGIIGLVLMQQGRGADAGAAFGSGASGSVFGAQGSASFLSRTTAIFATLFFCTSLGLAFLSGQTSEAKDLILEPKVEKVDVPVVEGAVPNAPGAAKPDVVVPTEGKPNKQ